MSIKIKLYVSKQTVFFEKGTLRFRISEQQSYSYEMQPFFQSPLTASIFGFNV